MSVVSRPNCYIYDFIQALDKEAGFVAIKDCFSYNGKDWNQEAVKEINILFQERGVKSVGLDLNIPTNLWDSLLDGITHVEFEYRGFRNETAECNSVANLVVHGMENKYGSLDCMFLFPNLIECEMNVYNFRFAYIPVSNLKKLELSVFDPGIGIDPILASFPQLEKLAIKCQQDFMLIYSGNYKANLRKFIFHGPIQYDPQLHLMIEWMVRDFQQIILEDPKNTSPIGHSYGEIPDTMTGGNEHCLIRQKYPQQTRNNRNRLRKLKDLLTEET
jgi:hypothetical protein